MNLAARSSPPRVSGDLRLAAQVFPVVIMQPPVVKMTDCSVFLRSFKQSKAAVRLREDMKKIVVVPLHEPEETAQPRVFGVSLQELRRQGLTEHGVPAVVWSLVEYLRRHGEWAAACLLAF